MATTANYGWTKPTVGGDTGAWGTILNTLFDAIDTSLKTVSDAVTAAAAVAAAALPLAGGTVTGRVDALAIRDKFVQVGNISGTGTFNLALGTAFTAVVTGDVTIVLSNLPTTGNYVTEVLIRLENGGAHTVTWPASVKWVGGTVPTWTGAGVDLIALMCFDSVSPVYFAVAALDVK